MQGCCAMCGTKFTLLHKGAEPKAWHYAHCHALQGSQMHAVTLMSGRQKVTKLKSVCACKVRILTWDGAAASVGTRGMITDAIPRKPDRADCCRSAQRDDLGRGVWDESVCSKALWFLRIAVWLLLAVIQALQWGQEVRHAPKRVGA